MQEPGVYFNPEAVRTLLAIAAEHGLLVEGIDVSHAYLHGQIDRTDRYSGVH